MNTLELLENYKNLRAIGDNILVVWIDHLEKEYEHHGLIFKRTLDRTRERWGVVISVGQRVKNVKAGDFITVENVAVPWGAAWMGTYEHVWCVYEKDILLVSNDYDHTKTLNGSPLAFNLAEINKNTDTNGQK